MVIDPTIESFRFGDCLVIKIFFHASGAIGGGRACGPPPARAALRAEWPLRLLAAALTAAVLLSPALTAEAVAQQAQAPLTQADIDAYVYLLPKLGGPELKGTDEAAVILRESGLSRKRAAYVAAKLTVAQALVEGYLSPERLDEERVPLYLQPSAQELALVNDNLETIKKAQEAAASASGAN